MIEELTNYMVQLACRHKWRKATLSSGTIAVRIISRRPTILPKRTTYTGASIHDDPHHRGDYACIRPVLAGRNRHQERAVYSEHNSSHGAEDARLCVPGNRVAAPGLY